MSPVHLMLQLKIHADQVFPVAANILIRLMLFTSKYQIQQKYTIPNF